MPRHSANFAALPALGLWIATTSPAQMQMPACHPMPAKTDLTAPESLPPPQKLTGIGNLHFPISSKNSETQVWFDQGIMQMKTTSTATSGSGVRQSQASRQKA